MQLLKSDRIFVAGHLGLIGSAIVKELEAKGYRNILTQTRAELNLLDPLAVEAFYSKFRPDVVFVSAAKVGGIHANSTYRAEFIYENLQVQNNAIWGAFRNDVRRLVFLGSSCIYPRESPQPMSESSLLTGALEYTNRPYAIAKIAGLELINAIRHQYQRDYFSVMPTNLFGPNDNFHIENSHVLPALLRRFADAKEAGSDNVQVWGSGRPRREFMYSLDCAAAIVFLAETLTSAQLKESPQGQHGYSHVNIGVGEDISIRELANIIAEHVGYKGKIEFDTSKPDGTMQKLLDISFLKSCGWKSQHTLAQGIKSTVDWYYATKKKRL